MKKAALVVDYLLFIVLFALMFIHTVGTLQTIKYLLLLLSAYFLFKTTMSSRKMKTTHVYNFLFMGATIVYVLYGAWYSGPLFANITLYFFVAALIGFTLALAYRQPVRKLAPPKKPVTKKKVAKKTAAKKTTKKATKKTARKSAKKTATKKKTTKKKTTKKTSKKKVAKKSTTKKKTSKKTPAKKATKNTASKKQAKRGRPKKNVAKRVTTTYYQ